MNNLWQIERLVELKQQEINRELENARLLKEAAVPGNNWLVRAVGALRGLVHRRKESAEDHPSVEQRSYPSLSD